MNDLVLVRDVTSAAFAPRYSPNYRIVAIHGPNRIVVRDEKGNETVRRASHLKVCDLKAKVASMIPEQNEYSSFGRSTKLLLHPKNVTDLQFSSKIEGRGEIPPEIETSEIQNTPNLQPNSKTEERGEISPKIEISAVQDIPDLQFRSKTEERGEIPPETEVSAIQVVSEKIKNIDLCDENSPQSLKVTKTQIIKTHNEYIVDYTGESTEHGEIPPEIATKEEEDELCKK